MLENGEAYLKNLVAYIVQDFYSMFGQVSILCMKRLTESNRYCKEEKRLY